MDSSGFWRFSVVFGGFWWFSVVVIGFAQRANTTLMYNDWIERMFLWSLPAARLPHLFGGSHGAKRGYANGIGVRHLGEALAEDAGTILSHIQKVFLDLRNGGV